MSKPVKPVKRKTAKKAKKKPATKARRAVASELQLGAWSGSRRSR